MLRAPHALSENLVHPWLQSLPKASLFSSPSLMVPVCAVKQGWGLPSVGGSVSPPQQCLLAVNQVTMSVWLCLWTLFLHPVCLFCCEYPLS